MPRIRSAKEWGKRPTAAVMQDDDFGHIDMLTGERKHPRDYWTEWDYRLINVAQLINDFTTNDGFLAWELDDPDERMIVSAYQDVDRVEQAKELFSKRNKKRLESPGSYVAVKLIKNRPEDEYPNHIDYFIRQSEKSE